MDAEIKEFIEKNIDLIEREDFEKLYEIINNGSGTGGMHRAVFTCKFTETLLEAGIDPTKYMKEIPQDYLKGASIQSYVIPSNITSIGDEAFYGCSELMSVTIPNSVTLIGDSAFSDCSSLTSITLPDSITHIGGYAFDGCRGLTGIIIPDKVTFIGYSAFEDCRNLTGITIPGGVTSIYDWTFQNCTDLAQVTLPSSVIQIASTAFLGCVNLKSINYLGTREQWKKIKKVFNWKKHTSLKEIKCADGIIKFPTRNVQD